MYKLSDLIEEYKGIIEEMGDITLVNHGDIYDIWIHFNKGVIITAYPYRMSFFNKFKFLWKVFLSLRSDTNE